MQSEVRGAQPQFIPKFMHKDTDLGPAESTDVTFWAIVDNIFQPGGGPRGALLPSAERL